MSAAPKAATAPKKVPTHPPYSDMIKGAILALKDRKGSSRQAIKKYILANYKIDNDEKRVSNQINAALKRGTESGIFVRPSGPSGTVKLAKPQKASEKKEVKKKPATAKPSESGEKKKASPKKTTKKAAAKTAGAKKAKKEIKKKSTMKKTAKKPAAKKATAKAPKAKKAAAKA